MSTEHTPQTPSQAPPSNPEVRYEKSDAHVRPLYQFLFWISVICVVTALMSWGILVGLGNWREGASARAVMAPSQDVNRQPPAPRVQTREMLDLKAFQTEEREILSTYGVVDRDQGIYRIPIEEAMKLTLERGLPVRGAEGPARPEAKAAPKAAPKAARK